MPDVHALLSASSSYRWLKCPPSVMLEKKFPNKTTSFAEEGTLAHELGEITLKYALNQIEEKYYKAELSKIWSNALFSKDMPDYIVTYTDICLEKLSKARKTTPDAVAFVEQRLDFSKWVPNGFGTGDFVVIEDGTMEICDLKYGKGVTVSAVKNPQMRLYALGAIAEFSILYDIQNVKMTIIQPRLDSISTDEITVKDLIKWAEDVVKPTAELAIVGKGEFKAGDHCRFCKAKAICRARADKNMELAKYDFQEPKTLDNAEISDILNNIDELTSWATDIKEYALEQALQGEKFDGFKVVEGRSNRRYTDIKAITEILTKNNFKNDDIFKPTDLITLTKMERLVGKKKLNGLIGDYIEKPQGKPTLARITDKRPVFNTAKDDFK